MSCPAPSLQGISRRLSAARTAMRLFAGTTTAYRRNRKFHRREADSFPYRAGELVLAEAQPACSVFAVTGSAHNVETTPRARYVRT